MTDTGWSRAESPFHPGEIEVQERLGVRNKIDQQGRRSIRDYLIEQHRQFYTQLPFLVAGTVDARGCPWASLLVGNPGFLSTPDDRTLHVACRPLYGDPLSETLADGVDIGLLGIELHTRRRNRLNGTVTAMGANGFCVQVNQSFGNCPQYIQARMFELTDGVENLAAPKPVYRTLSFKEPERSIISASDTFFIATAFHGEEGDAAKGVDVSHRGGKPGFVRVDGDGTLTFPDFVGNNMFNTIGNLLLNPRAGLLFVDFVNGNLLYLTGTAEVIWSGEEVRAFVGAQRLIRFQISEGYRVEGSLPLRYSAPDYSPFLKRTGSWEDVARAGAH